MSEALDYIKSPTGILKLVEIITVLVAVGICRGAQVNFGSIDDSYFGVGILVTSLVVTPLLLLCYLMGRLEIQKTIFEPVYNALMCLLLMVAGGLAIDLWSNTFKDGTSKREEGLAMGSFIIMAAIVYLADAVLAVREYRKA